MNIHFEVEHEKQHTKSLFEKEMTNLKRKVRAAKIKEFESILCVPRRVDQNILKNTTLFEPSRMKLSDKVAAYEKLCIETNHFLASEDRK